MIDFVVGVSLTILWWLFANTEQIFLACLPAASLAEGTGALEGYSFPCRHAEEFPGLYSTGCCIRSQFDHKACR